MIKKWKVKVELFWDASREETVIVEANTKRKAAVFAKDKIRKKYTRIGDMINIISIDEV